MRRRAAKVGEPAEQVYRISAAPHSHSDDLSSRMTRYLISMAIRTACVVLAVVVDGPLRWVFAAGAIGLPYIAVVMANAGNRPRDQAVPPPQPRQSKQVTSAPGEAFPRPRDPGTPSG